MATDIQTNPFEKLLYAKKEAEEELSQIVTATNAEALLTCMISQLLLMSPEQNIGDEFGNHPAMLEILAKECIPSFGKNSDLPISPLLTNHCYALLETIAQGKMFENFPSSTSGESASEIVAHLEMYSQIVRGSAYPEQTYFKIEQVQGRFDNWFEKTVGISPSRTVQVVLALVKHAETMGTSTLDDVRAAGNELKEKYQAILKTKKRTESEQQFLDTFPKGKDGIAGAFCCGYSAKLNEIMPELLPVELTELEIQPRLNDTEKSAFKELFSVNKDSIANVEHMQRKTFYEHTSGKIIFSEISNSFDVIWDKFEEIAKNDGKFYSSRYQKHKANWLEQRAYKHLCSIFPEHCVYRNLSYVDPTKENGTTELDLAVKWGPFLLIIEAKAKQFRFESVTGDAGRLRTDIKKNVADSYEQSLRAIQYIEENEKCEFTEIDSKRLLSFSRNDVHRIFPISMSFHHLAGVATQLNELSELGLFVEQKYPFSICDSDFELLTKAQLSPDTFLHYISRRLEVLQSNIRWQGDELDLISAYLDSRLLLPNMMDPSQETPDSISFGGYSKKFDQLMAFERGEYPDKPTIELKLPEGVNNIFTQLKSWDDNGARWISFALLELEDSVLYSVAQALNELKHTSITHDGFRRMSFHQGDTSISVVGSSVATFEELKQNMHKRGLIEKYRRKKQKSIVFGVLCNGNDKVFESADYMDFDWQLDDDMEALVESEPAFVPSTIPKRNDPCFCGSGKKYKKCHKNIVEENKRKYTNLA